LAETQHELEHETSAMSTKACPSGKLSTNANPKCTSSPFGVQSVIG